MRELELKFALFSITPLRIEFRAVSVGAGQSYRYDVGSYSAELRSRMIDQPQAPRCVNYTLNFEVRPRPPPSDDPGILHSLDDA